MKIAIAAQWMQPRAHLPGHPKAWVAISLAWSAGFIDLEVWLLVYRVYTSHMTGNTASLAEALAQGNWIDALRYGWVIVPYLFGLLYSAGATRVARQHGFHASFSVALITEIALLVAFMVVGAD